MKTAIRLTCLAIAVMANVVGNFSAFAESAPLLHNFQGRLTNSVGTPVTSPQIVTFRLIQGGTATESPSTGTVVYEEQATITPSEIGTFVHVIGSGSPQSGSALEEADFIANGLPLFVEMSLGSDTLLPRTQVLSTGYAIEASRLDGKSAAEIIGQSGGNAFVNEVIRSGAGIRWVSVTQVGIKPGVLGFADAKVRKNSAEILWDAANPNGPLGLDEGELVGATWYYLYAIPDPADDNRFSAIASLNSPPQAGGAGLSSTYPFWRYLGSFRNGSANTIQPFYRQGAYVSWGGRFQTFLSGSAVALPAVNTWVAVDLSSSMPQTAQFVQLNGYYDSCGSQRGRFAFGPGPATPSRFIYLCTDFGDGATTCEGLVPTVDQQLSWRFYVFTGGSNDTCQYFEFSTVAYIEDLGDY